MKIFAIKLICLVLLFACNNNKNVTSNDERQDIDTIIVNSFQKPLKLTLEQANKLVELPLECVNKKYPVRLLHTLGSKGDLKEPIELYPAFYGCYDWHSSVHGHWSMVKLLKEFPGLAKAEAVKSVLLKNISKQNILIETRYFKDPKNKIFERTYGWAWLLKLAEELHTWDSPLARELEQNLKPLTSWIVESFINYLPKLKYPIRSGEHKNTAFALSFALDYANSTQNLEFKDILIKKAKEFYLNDKDCPLSWEPSGYDYLSPCLQEIDIMRKCLTKEEFDSWLNSFAPQITKKDFDLKVAEVIDRTDSKLIHLDGLNFSRAWILFGLAKQYPKYNYLIPVGNKHINYAFPNIFSDTYEGGHWLGTFTIYALDN
jgi:hypothetical protein